MFEKHPDQIIFTTSAQKLQAVIMNLPYGVVAMNFQNPFLSNEKKGILDVQVIYDSCREFVPYNRSIGDKALNVLEFLSKQFF